MRPISIKNIMHNLCAFTWMYGSLYLRALFSNMVFILIKLLISIHFWCSIFKWNYFVESQAVKVVWHIHQKVIIKMMMPSAKIPIFRCSKFFFLFKLRRFSVNSRLYYVMYPFQFFFCILYLIYMENKIHRRFFNLMKWILCRCRLREHFKWIWEISIPICTPIHNSVRCQPD